MIDAIQSPVCINKTTAFLPLLADNGGEKKNAHENLLDRFAFLSLSRVSSGASGWGVAPRVRVYIIASHTADLIDYLSSNLLACRN